MAKKIINYKLKTSSAMRNLIKLDHELIHEGANENALTSNFFRRLRVKRDHKIEMEFDKYVFKTKVIEELINRGASTSLSYKPKPDIISHYKVRESDNVVSVIECKYFKKSGIISDYYKLWAYRIVLGIQQAQLVIYPKKGSHPPYNYKKSVSVGNISELEMELDSWNDNEGGIIDIIFNSDELDRIVSEKIGGIEVYKDENKLIIKIEGEDYSLFSSGNQLKEINGVHPSDDIISYGDSNYTKVTFPAKELIIPSKTMRLFEKLENIELFPFEGYETNQNNFGNNSMIKYYFENTEIHSMDPREKRRNFFIIAYSLEHGFVFGMRKITILDSSSFTKIENLGFGYSPGTTWTYFKFNGEMNHEVETAYEIILGMKDNFGNIIDDKKIKKEINIS